ncbi:hypothetical protein K431DRAFT_304653 [Polychaeton citri CBS 116435]|uniref:Uncharacterized protein n=1 Tax=Polychaeton citri CBS 116435 TaxID=1314669 RepID=A0A9P4UMU4_9PEZI|nr:hypothetical protein K431DRAFT_304653 [Polychaeton citri CBS 116435]
MAPIPVVLIGVTRPTAVGVSKLLDAHNATEPSARPYRLAAALDMSDTEQRYRYTPHNLGTALRALWPRPQALVTGTAIPDAIVHQIREVWEPYVEGVIRKEVGDEASLDATDGKVVWVQLGRTHGGDGPPPPGAVEEMLKRLDECFRSQ